MTRISVPLLVCTFHLGAAPLSAQSASSPPGFEMTRVADGVYAGIRTDSSANDLVANALGAVREQTEAAKAKGLDLEQTRKAMDMAAIGRRFAGDDKVRLLSWENYFVGLAVQRAFEQAGAAN